MRIALIGPCSPKDLSHILHDSDAVRALEFPGYRGLPVSSLAEALIQLGHQVFVITTANIDSGRVEIFAGPNLQIRVVSSRARARNRALTMFWKEIRNLSKEIENIDVDVAHAHWTYEFALSIINKRGAKVITAHDAPLTIFKFFRDPYRFSRLLLAVLCRMKAKKIVFVSPYLQLKWKKEMHWRGDERVVPNIAPFKVKYNRDYLKSSGIVLVVSEDQPRKNVNSVLNAWNGIKREVPGAQLHLVGIGLGKDDPLARKQRRQVEDPSIKWHGYCERQEIEYLMMLADISIIPSLEESQSLVALESMAHGLPVIADINSGGVPWTVADAGIYIDTQKPAQITAATCLLLRDKLLREILGERGRERIRLHFSPDVIASRYLEIYREEIQENIDTMQ